MRQGHAILLAGHVIDLSIAMGGRVGSVLDGQLTVLSQIWNIDDLEEQRRERMALPRQENNKNHQAVKSHQAPFMC